MLGTCPKRVNLTHAKHGKNMVRKKNIRKTTEKVGKKHVKTIKGKSCTRTGIHYSRKLARI